MSLQAANGDRRPPTVEDSQLVKTLHTYPLLFRGS